MMKKKKEEIIKKDKEENGKWLCLHIKIKCKVINTVIVGNTRASR